jgi:putative DNA primase/helicase
VRQRPSPVHHNSDPATPSSGNVAQRAAVGRRAGTHDGRSLRSPNGRPSSIRAALVPDSLAVRIVEMVRESGADLFHDAMGEIWISIPFGDHRETHRLQADVTKGWIAGTIFEFERRAASGEVLSTALRVLGYEARAHGPERTVYLRVAPYRGGLLLDLGDPQWRSVRISPHGWQIISHPSDVAFHRPPGILPLPNPEHNGSLDPLRFLLNPNLADRDWLLLRVWLVAALFPDRPCPLLMLLGEQGSAKSVTARLLRELVDPHVAPLLAPPESERDLLVGASASHVLLYDNLSAIPAWLADALAGLVTGRGAMLRRLYTDADLVVFNARRVVGITAIARPTLRDDLLDRTVTVTFPAIPDDRRRAEEEILREFERLRPRLLGGLLDATVVALQHLPSTHLPAGPRMYDFARTAVATASAFCATADETLAALGEARADVVGEVIENSPVAVVVQELAADAPWTGSASDLLRELRDRLSEDAQDRRDIPRTPNAVSAHLTRIAPALRSLGIEVSRDRIGHAGARAITLRHISSVQTPFVSQARPDASAAADHHAPQEMAPVTPGSFDSPPADDDRRIWVRDMGRELGWPRFSFGPDRAIAQGKEAWEIFAARAPQGDVDAAIRVLLLVGKPEEK